MYKVIRAFIDKETMKKHEMDTEYTPSSSKRGKELVEMGFLAEVKKPKKKSEKS